METVLSEARAKGIKRMLWATLACAVLIALFAILAAVTGNTPYAITLTVVGAFLFASAGFTLRVLPERGIRARRSAIVTGVLLLLLALPAVQIWVGLLMAIGGVGMLFIIFSKEVET